MNDRSMPLHYLRDAAPDFQRGGDLIVCRHGFWWFVSYSQRRTVWLDPIFRQSSWNVSELSRNLSLGSRTFSGIVARSIGRPAKVWLREHRLHTACHLLREGAKIEVVSAELGFHHHSAFSREFKAVMGVNPSVYLRKQQAHSRV